MDGNYGSANTSQHIPNEITSNGRGVDNTPVWMKRQKKKRRLWILRGQIFSLPAASNIRSIPLPVNNKLPAIEL